MILKISGQIPLHLHFFKAIMIMFINMYINIMFINISDENWLKTNKIILLITVVFLPSGVECFVCVSLNLIILKLVKIISTCHGLQKLLLNSKSYIYETNKLFLGANVKITKSNL